MAVVGRDSGGMHQQRWWQRDIRCISEGAVRESRPGSVKAVGMDVQCAEGDPIRSRGSLKPPGREAVALNVRCRSIVSARIFMARPKTSPAKMA